MNVFEILREAGEVDVWLQRRSWGNTVARVVSVGPMTTRAPYFGDPEIKVDLYDVRTGVCLDRDMRLSSCGTGQYCRVYGFSLGGGDEQSAENVV